MHHTLDKKLRKQLENTVIRAREIAEQAALEALTRLSIGDASPASYLDSDQRALRNRLRAHGRQLGDTRDTRSGQQETMRLCVEVAYEHWHRMLFARFLEQNNLLMYDLNTALTLDECQELSSDEGCANGWELAGKLASKMLPQVFRTDSPTLAVSLAFNHVRELEKLIAGLDRQTFLAADSLGWVYQFWQVKKKKEVNDSGVKIGADELSPVTQLFTEPYMVDFLLDNSLGAWWVTHFPEHRNLLPFTYLRTVGQDGQQVPVSGTFDGWPKHLADFKMLDPCCGSGHFLVATFLRLVPMRMAAENLSTDEAINAVLIENLHGLELDQRCVELAAFAVALEAWRYPGTGGYRRLPELNIACVGQRIQTPREQWLALAGENSELKNGMARLYDTFSDAPILGSLIDPARSLKGDLLTADWAQVQPLLEKALVLGESVEEDLQEAAITAQGLARAAELLVQRYHLLVTNVPYLGMRKQDSLLREFCESRYPISKSDLATVMLERCLELSFEYGVVFVVTQNAVTFKSYFESFREHLLHRFCIRLIAPLGPGAFSSISGEVVDVALIGIEKDRPRADSLVSFFDVQLESYEEKISSLVCKGGVRKAQFDVSRNPSSRMQAVSQSGKSLLSDFAICPQGIKTGDDNKWFKRFWENSNLRGWGYLQSAHFSKSDFGGCEWVLDWSTGGKGMIRPRLDSLAVGKFGVGLSQTGSIRSSIYLGARFDSNVAPIVPKEPKNLLPILAFCQSQDYSDAVGEANPGLFVTNSALLEVDFDLAYWSKIATEIYPSGLPKPYSDDPTQWIFHGHPQPSIDPLQVAVARLLGYRWPAQLDTGMELSDEARSWVERSNSLNSLADDDGIVCLPAVRGEKAAADRLENLLEIAFGADWTPIRRNQLLEQAGATILETWLRDKFFEQHCKLFHHRPFILHVWDGLGDGFSALVNYHKLNRSCLERLIYAYLGDWIRTQQHGVEQGLDGADVRLAAAQNLKARLERILEGEAPYDIFVRWKPLDEQPIGWNPDLNDGVRLNIRPFMTAEVLRHNKKPKLNIEWKKDRGNDVPSAPWFTLGLQYGEKEGARINDHHLSLAEKKKA